MKVVLRLGLGWFAVPTRTRFLEAASDARGTTCVVMDDEFVRQVADALARFPFVRARIIIHVVTFLHFLLIHVLVRHHRVSRRRRISSFAPTPSMHTTVFPTCNAMGNGIMSDVWHAYPFTVMGTPPLTKNVGTMFLWISDGSGFRFRFFVFMPWLRCHPAPSSTHGGLTSRTIDCQWVLRAGVVVGLLEGPDDGFGVWSTSLNEPLRS
jgi:hypothetical protein